MWDRLVYWIQRLTRNMSEKQTENERQVLKKLFPIEKLYRAFPAATKSRIDLFYEGFIDTFLTYEINTPIRVAAFLSQCAHESASFSATEENLNYSAAALRRVFRKYFPTDDLAAQYHRKPDKIANRVYGGRMGNGPESSGDGWRFRGRGLIQLTGKNNYVQCGADLKIDLVSNPEQVALSPLAVLTAGWFWSKNNLNLIADKEDIVLLTRRINGGTNGLEDRVSKYRQAKNVLV